MNWYNENNPATAAWLRELIGAGLIAPGVVDERSVTDVKPDDLRGYVQCHFFAGIGGWSYALRLAGWPDDEPVWTGSCPCQPFSIAGQGKADADERHLWPAFRELIAQCRPATVFGEQVASPLGREWLAGVRSDVEALGYGVGAADLCAACVTAPHTRQRLYWVAHAKHAQRRQVNGPKQDVIDGADPRRKEAHGQLGACGEVRGLARDQGQGRPGTQPERTGIERERARAGSGGGTDGVVFPDSTGRDARQPAAEATRHGRPAEPTGGVDGVGDANEQGSQGRSRVLECSNQWPPGTPNMVVLCSDGKARRFEPGSFPLAHGIPGRVGLLRGYGNAIVPQLAAQFIQASVEAMNDQS